MKNDVIIGRIACIQRITNSTNGNPRYRVELEDLPSAYNTAADHAFNYDIGNPGYRVGSDVVVIIGGRGTIVAIRPAVEV